MNSAASTFAIAAVERIGPPSALIDTPTGQFTFHPVETSKRRVVQKPRVAGKRP